MTMTILIRNVLLAHLGCSVIALAVALAAVAFAVTGRHHPRSRAVHGWRQANYTLVSPRRIAGLVRSPSARVSAMLSGTFRISSTASHSMALRAEEVQLDASAAAIVRQNVRDDQLHLIISAARSGDPAAYRDGELRQRDVNPDLAACPLVFVEVVRDNAAAISLTRSFRVRGIDIDGYPVLRISAAATAADCVASAALRIRDAGARPHLHFTVVDGHRRTYLLRYTRLATTANRTRDVIRQADSDITRRPVVHLDG
jgi:hypothetical protein